MQFCFFQNRELSGGDGDAFQGLRFGDAKVGTRFGGVSNWPSPHICLSREPSPRMVVAKISQHASEQRRLLLARCLLGLLFYFVLLH